jgi:hypothetical protein
MVDGKVTRLLDDQAQIDTLARMGSFEAVESQSQPFRLTTTDPQPQASQFSFAGN